MRSERVSGVRLCGRMATVQRKDRGSSPCSAICPEWVCYWINFLCRRGTLLKVPLNTNQPCTFLVPAHPWVDLDIRAIKGVFFRFRETELCVCSLNWVQGLGRVQCDGGGGGLPGAGSMCYRPGQPGATHHDDCRSVRSDDGDARPASGSRSDLNDSHCGLGDDSDAGTRSRQSQSELSK